MKCPFCGNVEDKVIDSRISAEGDSIRRRRECLKCQKRFTTHERLEEHPMMVIKKDGRREKFDRHKLLSGVQKACEKRPVSIEQVEEITNWVEGHIRREDKQEIKTSKIGELVMERLRKVDDVAYIRFASVYRSFTDIDSFEDALRKLKRKK